MANYAKSLPRDMDGAPMQEYAGNVSVLARYSSENATASSVISLTHDTTAVEIAAVGGPAVMRWVSTADTQASVVSAASGPNFWHAISTGTVRRFVVPIESSPTQGASVVGRNRGLGLYQRLAYKSIGVASVLTSEY